MVMRNFLLYSKNFMKSNFGIQYTGPDSGSTFLHDRRLEGKTYLPYRTGLQNIPEHQRYELQANVPASGTQMGARPS